MVLEIGAALNLCNTAFGVINKGIKSGHSALDLMDRFTQFYNGKDQIAAAEAASKEKPLLGVGSVEGQALQIVAAKAKTMEMEKHLRELILLTVPNGEKFYSDMLRERRNIRQRIIEDARRTAARKKHLINVLLVSAFCGIVIFIYSMLASAIINN
tara:strand:+ start:521 stop:988 length:468 start_codon:yes stop_codon:yes gene_type:complete